MNTSDKRRICIFSRYQLAEQLELAAEFRPMLDILCRDHAVLHLSFRNTRPPQALPGNLSLDEIPLKVNRNNPWDVLFKSLMMYLMLPFAAMKIRKFKPDLVFVPEILPLCGLLIKWMCGCRVATAYGDRHAHNFFGKKQWFRFFRRLAESCERYEALRLDGLFCRAAAAGRNLREWGVPASRIRVVFDAPDLSAFFPQNQLQLREKCGFTAKDIVLLYHGVMHQGKGLDMLIRWTASLYRENPLIGIIFVGTGPELEPLKKLAAEQCLGRRAYFTGWLKTIHEVGKYCNAADICVAMRSGAEYNAHIIPGALLHSMACRKIVLAPDLPGIREIVRHGENGYLFKPDDEHSFKAIIGELANRRSKWDIVAGNAENDIKTRFSVNAAASRYAEALSYFAGMEG